MCIHYINSDPINRLGYSMSLQREKMWKIWLSPGRRIRIIVKNTDEVVTVRFKLMKTAMSPESLSLTAAELLLIPVDQMLEVMESKSWTIYNGRNRITTTTDHENKTMTICDYRYRKSIDIADSSWCNDGEICFSRDEFYEFSKQVPEIIQYISNRVLKPMVLI